MVKTVIVAVPDEVAGTPLEQTYLEALQQVAKEEVVLKLYREHKLSTGRGARILEMSIYEFMRFLGSHQISIFDYEEGELEADLQAALAAARPQFEGRPAPA